MIVENFWIYGVQITEKYKLNLDIFTDIPPGASTDHSTDTQNFE